MTITGLNFTPPLSKINITTALKKHATALNADCSGLHNSFLLEVFV